MAQELLTPEEEQQQDQETQDLENQFARPAIEDYRRNAGPSYAQRAQQAGSFVAKNKKWFIGGGGALALIIPIAAFFFWMMLFKNVHIKNLYVTYRWAQFNRGIHKTLKAQLEYAKANPDNAPKGKASTTVSATDSPDAITRATNSDEFNADKINPDDVEAVEAEAKKVTSVEQSVEGGTQKALDDVSVTRSVQAVEGDTPEERAESAKTNVEEELGKNRALEGDVPPTLEEGVEKAKEEEAAGKSAKEAAEAGADAVKNGKGFLKIAKTVGTVTEIATFACLFRDIYLNAKEQINKIALGGAMAVAQETNKTADCQKAGKCLAEQVGAVAEKYDNETQSFTQSCGYTRATQSSNPACTEIDPQFVVDGVADEIGGLSGGALKTADAILDPPISFLNTGANTTCKVVMDPFFQAADSILSLGFTVASGGGWQAAKTAVVKGGVVFAGTAGGKALIASTIMKYSGTLYNDLRPWDMGNLKDMGDMVTASAACATSYCPEVSDETAAHLDREYRTERIAANSKRSILEKFFDTESPDSVVARVAMNSPSTPQAALGRIKTVFASISNPTKLSKAVGESSLALQRNDVAYAADDGASAYGLSGKLRVPPSLLNDASYAEIVNWGKNANLSDYSKYDKCASDPYATGVSSDDDTCKWESMDGNGKMYMTYKYTQNAVFKNAIANNNQDTAASTGGGAGGATAVATGEKGVDTAGQKCTVGTQQPDATMSNGTKIALCDIGGGMIVNVSAAQAFYEMKAEAQRSGVTLSGSGFRDPQRQIELRRQHCGSSHYAIYEMSPNSCSPPTARPGQSNHEEGLAVDFHNSSYRSTAVYQWLAANAARFNIKNLPSEPWHWSTTGT